MTRPTKAQVHHAMTHREGWSFMGSETTMPGTGWEKFEVLAAEVEALRDELAAAEAKLSSRGITELVTLFTDLRQLAELVMADHESPYLEHNARVALRAWLNEHPAVEPV